VVGEWRGNSLSLDRGLLVLGCGRLDRQARTRVLIERTRRRGLGEEEQSSFSGFFFFVLLVLALEKVSISTFNNQLRTVRMSDSNPIAVLQRRSLICL
jgi:hypothetical protein